MLHLYAQNSRPPGSWYAKAEKIIPSIDWFIHVGYIQNVLEYAIHTKRGGYSIMLVLDAM
jgi:hypothetical protein